MADRFPVRFACSIAVTLFASCAIAAAAVDGPDETARDMLASLCGAARRPSHVDEPVCRARATLGEDDAWRVLWNACRMAEDAAVPPCPVFRQRAGGVLVYHAGDRTWDAEWESRVWPLTFDVAGTPTLRLNPRDSRRLHIVVDDISPMTYAAHAGTPKEDDIAVMPGLATILELAGAGARGVITTLAARPPVSVADVVPRAAPVCAPDATTVAGELRAHAGAGDVLTADLARLVRELEAVDARRAAFTQVLQHAERGEPVGRADFVRPDLADLDAAAAAVDASADLLTAASRGLASCNGLLTAYAVLLDAGGAADAVPTLAAQVSAAAVSCQDARLRDALLADTHALLECGSAIPQALKSRAAAITPYLDRLVDTADRDDTLQASVRKIRGLLPAGRAAAETLTAEIDRAERHTWQGALVRQLVVSRPNPALGWNKVQSHSIVLAADSPYSKELVLAHEKQESHPYRIASAAGGLLGYGIGVVYTPLTETTWTAAPAASGRGKVIAPREQTSRAGDLAAFLSYRFLEHRPRHRAVWLEPTADAGVGLTSARLAFFLGGGLEFFHAARLGAGWSPQRVTVLAPGQIPGVTPVTSADEIRTIDRFELRNWYVSFSFALDGAPVFHDRR